MVYLLSQFMYFQGFTRNLKVSQHLPVTGKSKYSFSNPYPVSLLQHSRDAAASFTMSRVGGKAVISWFVPLLFTMFWDFFFSSTGFRLACAVVFGQPHFQYTSTHIQNCAGISVPLQQYDPPDLEKPLCKS